MVTKSRTKEYIDKCNEIDIGFKIHDTEELLGLFLMVVSPESLKKQYGQWQHRVLKNMDQSGDFEKLRFKTVKIPADRKKILNDELEKPKCNCCNGRGRHNQPDMSGMGRVGATRSCDQCYGSGRVKKQTGEKCHIPRPPRTKNRRLYKGD